MGCSTSATRAPSREPQAAAPPQSSGGAFRLDGGAPRSPRRLEDAFRRSQKGRIVINSLGYDIALARSTPTESGRVVRVFTVRHLGFDESVGRSRSREYPFGMIELQLGHNGRGDGVLVVAARLLLDPDGRLAVETFRETFGTPAFRLLNVEASERP